MMFYVIFASGLLFPRLVALPVVGVTLAALVILGPLVQSETVAYLASPIVLWFVLGMGLAVLWRWRRCREPEWMARTGRVFEPLGDASYSIYLVHGLILTMLFRGWMLLGGSPTVWIVPLGLVAATFSGWAVHILVEIPTLRMTANIFKPGRKIYAGVKLPDAP
jgi:peptidoglycan/LPS O-acetylase OafA/YrhL